MANVLFIGDIHGSHKNIVAYYIIPRYIQEN